MEQLVMADPPKAMDGITFRLALSALVQLEQSQHQLGPSEGGGTRGVRHGGGAGCLPVFEAHSAFGIESAKKPLSVWTVVVQNLHVENSLQ